MSDLIELYLAHLRPARATNTVTDCRRWLLYLDRRLPEGVDRALPEELELILGTAGWRPKTRATYWAHTVGFYRWAVSNFRLDWDPSARLIRPRVPKGMPRPVTDDQVRRALRELQQPWRLAVLLATAVGMRRAEICNARREDFINGVVIIEGKGGKTRSVPVPAEVWAMIEPMPAGLLVTDRGQPWNLKYFSIAIRQQLDAIGLNGVTPHRFRHWFGTTAQRRYKDLQVTQQLMGHATPATTVGYAQLTDSHLRLAIDEVAVALSEVLNSEDVPTTNRHVPSAA
jgi:integrase